MSIENESPPPSLSPTAAIEPLGEDHDLALVGDIRKQAETAEAEIPMAGTTIGLAGIKAYLQSLHFKIPQGIPGSGVVQGIIDKAMTTADEKIKEVSAQEEAAMTAILGASGAEFASGMHSHMTGKEQNFFDSFVPGQQYQMGKWQNGAYVDSGETVDGAQLRQDFALIKYHSLENKKGVTPPPGGEDMDNLDKALDHMEGYEGHKLSGDDARHCHEKFEGVREKIRRVKSLRAMVQDPVHDKKTAGLALDHAEGDLRHSLQTDIIDGTLLPEQDKQHQRAPKQETTVARAPQGSALPITAGTMAKKPEGMILSRDSQS